MKTQRHLIILFNRFGSDPLKYVLTVTDEEGDIVERRMLTRKPVGRFETVSECGCGAKDEKHLGWCTKLQTLHGQHHA